MWHVLFFTPPFYSSSTLQYKFDNAHDPCSPAAQISNLPVLMDSLI